MNCDKSCRLILRIIFCGLVLFYGFHIICACSSELHYTEAIVITQLNLHSCLLHQLTSNPVYSFIYPIQHSIHVTNMLIVLLNPQLVHYFLKCLMILVLSVIIIQKIHTLFVVVSILALFFSKKEIYRALVIIP